MIKVVFFATPKIALKTLEKLFRSKDFEVCAVVTQPDKPAGRGHRLKASPIKTFALEHDIKVFQPKSIKKDFEIQAELKALSPDFFVTFAFGQILSADVLAIPKFATVNLHASLLPKYRGANPIQRAVIAGETQTGICTMITELGLDCGAICLCEKIPITEETDCQELFEAVSRKSPELMEKTLLGLYHKTIVPIPQSGEFCLAPKLEKSETELDWNKSAKELNDLVRGVCRCPSAYFEMHGKIVKVIKTKVLAAENATCGEFFGVTKEGIKVATADGTLLLLTVKPEGKGEMNATDWFRGLR